MVAFLIKWLILSAAFWGTAQILPGVKVRSFGSSIVVSAIFGLLSFFVGWFLFAFLTITTFGLAYLLAFITWWVIAAVMLLFTDALTDRFEVDGFGIALLAALVIALLNGAGHWMVNTFVM
jgi:putative membrane protein